jgi:hypothetical protein
LTLIATVISRPTPDPVRAAPEQAVVVKVPLKEIVVSRDKIQHVVNTLYDFGAKMGEYNQ